MASSADHILLIFISYPAYISSGFCVLDLIDFSSTTEYARCLKKVTLSVVEITTDVCCFFIDMAIATCACCWWGEEGAETKVNYHISKRYRDEFQEPKDIVSFREAEFDIDWYVQRFRLYHIKMLFGSCIVRWCCLCQKIPWTVGKKAKEKKSHNFCIWIYDLLLCMNTYNNASSCYFETQEIPSFGVPRLQWIYVIH